MLQCRRDTCVEFQQAVLSSGTKRYCLLRLAIELSFTASMLNYAHFSHIIIMEGLPPTVTLNLSGSLDLATEGSVPGGFQVALPPSSQVFQPRPHLLVWFGITAKLPDQSPETTGNIGQPAWKSLMFNDRFLFFKHVHLFFWALSGERIEIKKTEKRKHCVGGDMPWSLGRPVWSCWLWFTEKKMKFTSPIHLAEMS